MVKPSGSCSGERAARAVLPAMDPPNDPPGLTRQALAPPLRRVRRVLFQGIPVKAKELNRGMAEGTTFGTDGANPTNSAPVNPPTDYAHTYREHRNVQS